MKKYTFYLNNERVIGPLATDRLYALLGAAHGVNNGFVCLADQAGLEHWIRVDQIDYVKEVRDEAN